MTRIIAILMLALLCACTWVKPTAEGAKVNVAAADAVSACENLGKVSVSLKHEVARVERSAEKVAGELETLARNEGALMGGDTVSPQSKVTEGRQEFGVYRCGKG